jgi:hypothetical protein
VDERQQIIERNHRLFGVGADGPDRIYRVGPDQDLVGKTPEQAGLAPLDVDLTYSSDYANVDSKTGFVPSFVVGQVKDGGKPGRSVAVAVNGKIVGTGQTFTLATGEGGQLVAVMVPTQSFKQGRNDVRVYLAP